MEEADGIASSVVADFAGLARFPNTVTAIPSSVSAADTVGSSLPSPPPSPPLGALGSGRMGDNTAVAF